jgi:hypothetical protein
MIAARAGAASRRDGHSRRGYDDRLEHDIAPAAAKRSAMPAGAATAGGLSRRGQSKSAGQNKRGEDRGLHDDISRIFLRRPSRFRSSAIVRTTPAPGKTMIYCNKRTTQGSRDIALAWREFDTFQTSNKQRRL